MSKMLSISALPPTLSQILSFFLVIREIMEILAVKRPNKTKHNKERFSAFRIADFLLKKKKKKKKQHVFCTVFLPHVCECETTPSPPPPD